MNLRLLLFVTLALLINLHPAISAPGQATRTIPQQFIPDKPPEALPPPQVRLAYSVVIENKKGGVIRVVDPPAQFLLNRPGTDIGHVLRPAISVDKVGYHASSWGALQTVVASAVNALHFKVYDNPDTGRAGIVTVLPEELYGRDLQGHTRSLRGDEIYTDIKGGHGIFGGSHPLIVGNPVSIYRDGARLFFDPAQFELAEGDIIIIEVRVPAQWPQGLVVDNRSGGSVTLIDASGGRIDCGTVSKPVSGSGRFEGGVFCESGGIRATHTAVLDLDFSPAKCMGGLQLIPLAHSKSKELKYSQSSPPYGILEGPGGSDLRSCAPLFSGYLYPISQIEPPLLLPRLEISVQLDDTGEWKPLPSLVGRTDLREMTALRVDWVLGTPL
ncbi:MAG: hypothetical protein M3R04_06660 [bacterium]|nr:hypothetical protein [bacterium]